MVADPRPFGWAWSIFVADGDDLWSMRDPQFFDFAARELEKIGMIDRREVMDGTVVRVPKAYPAYFGEYRDFDRCAPTSTGSAISTRWDAMACIATTIRTIPCWPRTAPSIRS